jgi:hypothetical protein
MKCQRCALASDTAFGPDLDVPASNANAINQTLNLNLPVTARTGAKKMNDALAVQVFSFCHCVDLYDAGDKARIRISSPVWRMI